MPIPIVIEVAACPEPRALHAAQVEEHVHAELERLVDECPHSQFVLVTAQGDWFGQLCARVGRDVGATVVQPREDGVATRARGHFAVDGLQGKALHGLLELYRDSVMLSTVSPDALARTDAFNADCLALANGERAPGNAAGKADDGQDGAQGIASQHFRDVYDEADSLSVSYQGRYLSSMFLLSLCCVTLVLAFLLYDEAELRLMLVAYGLVMVAYALLYRRVMRVESHERYVSYRVLAETLRVQGHLASLGIADNAADAFPWTQQEEVEWVRAAVGSLALCAVDTPSATEDEVRKEWIDDQAAYHRRAFQKDGVRSRTSDVTVWAMLDATVLIYVLTTVLEYLFPQVMDVSALGITVCSWLKIALGCASAVTLFVSGYYGSLSLERKVHDHQRMALLFERAAQVFDEDPDSRQELFRQLAREEVIENGTWMSYCSEDRPTFSL